MLLLLMLFLKCCYVAFYKFVVCVKAFNNLSNMMSSDYLTDLKSCKCRRQNLCISCTITLHGHSVYCTVGTTTITLLDAMIRQQSVIGVLVRKARYLLCMLQG